MATSTDALGPVLHVVVVGFHHKKGCQVEYAYPPLVEGQPVNSHEIPPKWKNLPSLALPDGSHNYESDTIFFHLPSEEDDRTTIYGVSCYRQMNASDLLNRGSDVTRNTVQKSVCVLSQLPLYGLIQAKLELITHAYFDEKDFTKVSLLEETHRNLNAGLTASLLQGSQVFLGIPCRDVVNIFKHKVLVLFKLMMLERKVLFFGTPVQPVCTTLLSILSLFPEMTEQGMKECAKSSPKKLLSPTLGTARVSDAHDGEDFLEVRYTSDPSKNNNHDDTKVEIRRQSPKKHHVTDALDVRAITQVQSIQATGETHDMDCILSMSPHTKDEDILQHVEDITHTERVQRKRTSAGSAASYVDESLTQQEAQMLDNEMDCFSWEDDKVLLEIDEALVGSEQSSSALTPPSKHNSAATPIPIPTPKDSFNLDTGQVTTKRSAEEDMDSEIVKVHRTHSRTESGSSVASTASNLSARALGLKQRLTDSLREMRGAGSRESSVELDELRPVTPTTLPADDCGFPLNIFTKGMICHPYLSLQYYDILQDPNVRGFVVGASNILYKQKRNAVDVITELSDARVEILDPELRRQLTLTTADLRFAENLVKMASENQDDLLFGETGWEGGDEWIRLQFRLYLQSLLATVRYGDEKSQEDFNSSFVSAWKTTNNYKQWRTLNPRGLEEVQPTHPCHGQMSVADMKLRFSHNLQNTERGKKVNAALSQTSKVVMQTGKAVGGAITSARSAVSSWFRSWSVEEEEDADVARSDAVSDAAAAEEATEETR